MYITGITFKSKHTVKYPDFTSATKPLPQSEELPVPKPPENLFLMMTSLILIEIMNTKKGTMLTAI
jgi:hypothetical protein